MAQIFFLAASISPDMLPVVSRQKTTSTSGCAFFWFGSSANDQDTAAASTRPTHKNLLNLPILPSFGGNDFGFRYVVDESGANGDCNGAVKSGQHEFRFTSNF